MAEARAPTHIFENAEPEDPAFVKFAEVVEGAEPLCWDRAVCDAISITLAASTTRPIEVATTLLDAVGLPDLQINFIINRILYFKLQFNFSIDSEHRVLHPFVGSAILRADKQPSISNYFPGTLTFVVPTTTANFVVVSPISASWLFGSLAMTRATST